MACVHLPTPVGAVEAVDSSCIIVSSIDSLCQCESTECGRLHVVQHSSIGQHSSSGFFEGSAFFRFFGEMLTKIEILLMYPDP